MTGARVRLIVAALLFCGWLGWLGYASLAKNRGPVVSRSRAAAATHAVRAEVGEGPAVTATVREVLRGDGLAPGAAVDVPNMPDAVGFDGPGDYLLLLVKNPTTGTFTLAGQQRSPGYDLGWGSKPTLYKWADTVPAQAEHLFR